MSSANDSNGGNNGGRLGINERFGIEGQWETIWSNDLDDLDIPGGLREQFELTTEQGLSVDVKTNDYLSVLGTVTIPFDNTFKLIGKAGLSYHWLKYDVSPYTYQRVPLPNGFEITPVFDDPIYELDEKGFTPMVSLGFHYTARRLSYKTDFELGLALRFTEELSDTSTFLTLRRRF